MYVGGCLRLDIGLSGCVGSCVYHFIFREVSSGSIVVENVPGDCCWILVVGSSWLVSSSWLVGVGLRFGLIGMCLSGGDNSILSFLNFIGSLIYLFLFLLIFQLLFLILLILFSLFLLQLLLPILFLLNLSGMSDNGLRLSIV